MVLRRGQRANGKEIQPASYQAKHHLPPDISMTCSIYKEHNRVERAIPGLTDHCLCFAATSGQVRAARLSR